MIGLTDLQYDAFGYGDRAPVVTEGLAITISPPA